MMMELHPTALDSRWFTGAVTSMMVELVAMIICAGCLIAARLYASAVLAVVTAVMQAASIALHLGGTVAHVVRSEPVRNAAMQQSMSMSMGPMIEVPAETKRAAVPELEHSPKDLDALQPSASVATALPPGPPGLPRTNSGMSVSLNSISNSFSRSPSSGKITVNTIDRDHRVVVASSGGAVAGGAARDLTPIEISPSLSRVSSVNEVRRIGQSDGMGSISGAKDEDSASSMPLHGIGPMIPSPRQRALAQQQHQRDAVPEPLMVPENSNRVVSVLCCSAYVAFATCAVIEAHNASFAVAGLAGCANLLMPWLYAPRSGAVRVAVVLFGAAVWLTLTLVNAFALNHPHEDLGYFVEYGAVPVALFACVISPIVRLLGAANISLADTEAAIDIDTVENGLWDIMCENNKGEWIENLHHFGLATALGHFIESYYSAQQFVPNDQELRNVADTPHSSERWVKISSSKGSITSRPSSAAFLQSTLSVAASEFPNTPTVTLSKGKVALICVQEQSTQAALSRYSDVSALTAVYHAVEGAIKNVPAVTVLPGTGQCIQIAIRYVHHSDLAGKNALRCATAIAEGCQREGIPVTVAVVCGMATVGVFGTAPKTVRLVGAMSEAAVALCALANTLKSTIICDEDIASECALTHLMNPIELVQLQPWNFPRVLYRVVKPFDPLREEGVEWMYQIQRISEQIPPSAWDLRRAFMAFVRADAVAALHALQNLKAEDLVDAEFDLEVDHLTARCRAVQTAAPIAQPAIPVLISMSLAVGVPPESTLVNPVSVLRPRSLW